MEPLRGGGVGGIGRLREDKGGKGGGRRRRRVLRDLCSLKTNPAAE
jgi:hypothetical protein